jgi:hypothetical protein
VILDAGSSPIVVPFDLGSAGHNYIASADLDADGWLDLVTLDGFRDRAVVYYGAPGGAFKPSVVPDVPGLETIAAIAIADADSDGRLDIAVAGVCWWDRELAELGRVGEIIAGDFDGDARTDIVAAGSESALSGEPAFAVVLRSARDFAPEARFALGVVAEGRLPIAAGDLDADGDLDLACANPSLLRGENGVRVFLNNGYGVFAPGPRLESAAVRDLASGDLDGDGTSDIAATMEPGVLVVWTSHGGGRAFSRVDVRFAAELTALVLGDFDGDGRVDDAAFAGRPSATEAWIAPLLGEPSTLATDCDADGVPDDCEIAAGDEDDCDGDGVLDRCESGGDPCSGSLFAYRIDGPSELALPELDVAVRGEYVVAMVPLGEARESRFGGAQGWSLSVAAERCKIVTATVAGTAGASRFDDPPGLRTSGFEVTELAASGDLRGAVSAVVLSAVEPITLPIDRPSPVCRLTVEASVPAGGRDGIPRLAFIDGLRGSGQPVSNRVTWQGTTYVPALSPRSIRLRLGIRDHRRGDANGDGRVDISGSIALLSYLFLGAATPACLHAADTDDSGDLDITDGAAINIYLSTSSSEGPRRRSRGRLRAGAIRRSTRWAVTTTRSVRDAPRPRTAPFVRRGASLWSRIRATLPACR